jgi:hypothetical protein
MNKYSLLYTLILLSIISNTIANTYNQRAIREITSRRSNYGQSPSQRSNYGQSPSQRSNYGQSTSVFEGPRTESGILTPFDLIIMLCGGFTILNWIHVLYNNESTSIQSRLKIWLLYQCITFVVIMVSGYCNILWTGNFTHIR